MYPPGLYWPSISRELRDYNNPNYLKRILEIEELILVQRDFFIGYSFAVDVLNYYPHRIQEMILSLPNNDWRKAQYSFLFAKNVKNVNSENLKLLENAVWESGDGEYITKFACSIEGVVLDRYEQFIHKSQSARFAYMFIKSKKCKNPEVFKKILIKSKKPRYIFEIAKHLSQEERVSLEDIIVASKSNMYVRLYAKHIEGADIKKLEKRIIKTKNIGEMKKFAKTVKGSKCDKFGFMF